MEERMARASEILSHVVFFLVFVWQSGGFALRGRGYKYSVGLLVILPGAGVEQPKCCIFWRRTCGSARGVCCQGLKNEKQN